MTILDLSHCPRYHWNWVFTDLISCKWERRYGGWMSTASETFVAVLEIHKYNLREGTNHIKYINFSKW